MEAILTQLIQSQGIWAVLFVFLLLYTIKKNDKLDELQDAREKEYRELLLELTDKFTIVNEINSKLDTLCTQYSSADERVIPSEPPFGGSSGRIRLPYLLFNPVHILPGISEFFSNFFVVVSRYKHTQKLLF